jgi:hypothetical protein
MATFNVDTQRHIERLLALFRFEAEPVNGWVPQELLLEFTKLAYEVAGGGAIEEAEGTDAALDAALDNTEDAAALALRVARWRTTSIALAESLLRTLVELGYRESVEVMLEHLAKNRRSSEAA